MDGISELAKMLKERESRPYMGPRVGEVVSPLPEIKVALEDGIILDKTHLVVAAHVLSDYQRELKFNGMSEYSNKEGQITLKKPPPPEEEPEVTEDWGILSLFGISDVEQSGRMVFTDTLKPGDKVILVPSTDEQIYFLVDRAVIL